MFMRTLHILAFAIVVGGHYAGASRESLLPLLYVAICTGAALVAFELLQSLHCLHQFHFILVLLKLGLLLLVEPLWDLRVLLLAAVVVLGSVGSHMPARYRHYSVVFRREWGRPKRDQKADSSERAQPA